MCVCKTRDGKRSRRACSWSQLQEDSDGLAASEFLVRQYQPRASQPQEPAWGTKNFIAGVQRPTHAVGGGQKVPAHRSRAAVLRFQSLTPPARSWARFHFGKMTARQGDFAQAVPGCGPESENTLPSVSGKGSEQLGSLHSSPGSSGVCPREKLAESIQQREEFKASAHCPAVSPEFPGARPSPLSSQGLSFVARRDPLDPHSAALGPGSSQSGRRSEGACRPG